VTGLATPLRLREGKKLPGIVAVRGEVLLPNEALQALHRERVEQGEEPFANPATRPPARCGGGIPPRSLGGVMKLVLEIQKDHASVARFTLVAPPVGIAPLTVPGRDFLLDSA
jgi:hypothetical protein